MRTSISTARSASNSSSRCGYNHPLKAAKVNAASWQVAKQHHPDAGGSDRAMHD